MKSRQRKVLMSMTKTTHCNHKNTWAINIEPRRWSREQSSAREKLIAFIHMYVYIHEETDWQNKLYPFASCSERNVFLFFFLLLCNTIERSRMDNNVRLFVGMDQFIFIPFFFFWFLFRKEKKKEIIIKQIGFCDEAIDAQHGDWLLV